MKLLVAFFLILVIAFTGFPIKADADVQKGLAMAYPGYSNDLTRLDISWWYDWSSSHYSDTKYVPMSWCGEDPNLNIDYSGFVILFNEPEVESQCNITPQQGIGHYLTLQTKYPNIKWVVGNTTFWGEWQYWLNYFWDICNANKDCIMPDYWGVHIYLSGDAEKWIPFTLDNLNKLHDYIGGTFWVTEFAEINGNIVTDKALVRLFNSIDYVDRYAYFTNRSQITDPWIINGWNISLLDWDTEKFTAIGNWYANKFVEIYLPMVKN